MPAISFKIPYDSNLRYLPLVYLLPGELWYRCPSLMKIPRNPRQVFRSEELLSLIDSDAFLDEIMDAVSSLAFPHFGFPGWKEHYTGDFPVWRLSYSRLESPATVSASQRRRASLSPERTDRCSF